MTDDWQKLDALTAAKILAEVNPSIEPVQFQIGSTTLRHHRLSFFKGYDFVELTDMSAIPAARKYAIYKPGDVNIINWTNQAIYEVAEKAPITLDDRTAVDYVKFFFTYVRGRHGRFQIIETIDDIKWQVEPPLQGRKIMQEMLEPVTVVSEDADGTINLEAYMVFKDSLFKTKIHVKKNGLVSMSDEELKIEGMPVLQDVAA